MSQTRLEHRELQPDSPDQFLFEYGAKKLNKQLFLILTLFLIPTAVMIYSENFAGI